MIKFEAHKIRTRKKKEKKDIFPEKLLGKKKIKFRVEKEKEEKKEKVQKYEIEEKKEKVQKKEKEEKIDNKEKEEVKDKEQVKFVISSSENGHWSWEEHKRFVEAIVKYGIQWEKIKYAVKTRTDIQIRSHAQKFYKKLKKYKNEQLGIDFTSNTIHNIKDMIAHVRSLNDNYDLVKIFLYFPKLCKMQRENADLEDDNNNIYEHLLNDNKKDNFKKDSNETSKIDNRIDKNKNYNINNNNINNFLNLYINYINTINYISDFTITDYIYNQIIINNGFKLLFDNYLKNFGNIPINNHK